MLKVLFMGTPDFAKESLEHIYNSKHEVLGVVTKVDRPKGRGMKMVVSPVKEFALSNNIKIFQPDKVKNNPQLIDEIKKMNPDIICVVAYGKILPKELLDIPKYGCVNVHGSLLPKYRGAAPIQWAVINGESVTGITTMYMDIGMDTGDMILKQEVVIGEDETTGELWQRMSKIGGELLVKTLDLIEKGKAPREKQEGESSLAPMLDRSIAKIDWENKSALEIKNLVRGLDPIMGAYSFINEKKLKFWKIDVLEENHFIELFPEFKEYEHKMKKIVPGTVLFADSGKGLYIYAKGGIIQVLEIQAENARRMNILDFLRGNVITAGSVFD